jgi:hypothetical protein
MTRRHFSTRGGAQVKIAARSPMSTAAATRRSPSSGVCEGKFQRECDQTFGCRTRSPMVPTDATRWPPCRGQGGMGISKFEVVARDGIEPSTRGFSVQGRAPLGARRPKTGKGFSRTRPNRPPRPSPFRARPTELRTEPAPGAMRVKRLRRGGPNRASTRPGSACAGYQLTARRFTEM